MAAEASEKKYYDLGAKETKVRLADELAGFCRVYCLKVWTDALKLTGVLVASE